MTISTELRKAGPFTGNGATTAFPFFFKVFAASDVAVTRADTLGAETGLVLNTDFTVALNADQDAAPGGTVTLAAPLSTGYRLVVSSAVPSLQPTDITNNGGFYPRVIEDALDRHVAQIQQIDEKVGRSLKYPLSDNGGNPTLPSKDQRRGRVLAFHETSGDPMQGPLITSLDTVTAHVGNVDTVAASIADVNAVADSLGNIAAVAGDLDNVDTVGAAIANVNAVGADIASVNSAAANMAAIIAAPTQAANAEASATAAQTARTGAETARDAAFVNANVYASAADGLAAVA